MTRINISLEGGSELDRALRDLLKNAEHEIDEAIQATGQSLQRDIVERINAGSGTVSRPGEAPNTQSGKLAASVKYQKEGHAQASVSSDEPHAPAQEFGTGRIEPRPAWIPAAEQARDDLRNALIDAIKKATK